MIESWNKPSTTSFNETQLNKTIVKAPTKQTIQYVSNSIFLIFNLGKNKIEQINNIQVKTEIIIVASIKNSFKAKDDYTLIYDEFNIKIILFLFNKAKEETKYKKTTNHLINCLNSLNLY
jgi:hypothetical protein